jgi:hypothetical protein
VCWIYGKSYFVWKKPLEMTVEKAERIRFCRSKKTGSSIWTAPVVRFWTAIGRSKRWWKNAEFGDIYMDFFSRCSEPQKMGNDWLFDPVTGRWGYVMILVGSWNWFLWTIFMGPAERRL